MCFGRAPSYFFDHQPSEILRTPNGCIQTVYTRVKNHTVVVIMNENMLIH